MTDRELLELAAKAAGYSHYNDGYVQKPNVYEQWNPLTDDGDALRLAVKLELDIQFMGTEVFVYLCAKLLAAEKRRGDTIEATRRAIVRAAAEIGKDMKGGER